VLHIWLICLGGEAQNSNIQLTLTKKCLGMARRESSACATLLQLSLAV